MWRFILFFLFFLSVVAKGQDSYFQQDVDYKIDVTLNDHDHCLNGHIQISYTNNSPDVLDTIWIHLWPNAYRTDQTALAKQLLKTGDYTFHYSNFEERGLIDSLDFYSTSGKLQWGLHPQHIDIGYVIADSPVDPGKTFSFSTPFFVKIPNALFSRLGHINESYMITQWYPKPAVYDKDGWHAFPYLNQGEFFSEFGDFEVKITVPRNYVVGATGNLQEESEKAWLLERIAWTDSVLKTTSFKEIKYSGINIRFPESAPQSKTLTFKASNVHDFAWFADKRFFVTKGEVELPYSKKKVDTYAMFTGNEAHLWKKANEYLHDATYYYSLWNGDYPYDHVTAVDGTIAAGGGMEYPNITVIGSSYTGFALETVIMHEVGHNWFYGILGSNERRFAWLDEGLNSLNESRYVATKYPDLKMTEGLISLPKGIASAFRLDIYKHLNQYHLFYLVAAARNMDQPMNLTSEEYTNMNYGGIVYSKTAAVFNYLRNYLGDETFDNCMRTYFDRWKFKHPSPEDLQKVIEEVSGKEMDWFFDDIINTTGTLDFKIKKAKKPEEKTVWRDAYLKVSSKGTINGPFSVAGIKNDSVMMTIWYDSVPENKVIRFPETDVDAWRIDPFIVIPEIDRKNNTLKRRGMFKKTEKLRLQWMTGIEDPDRTTIYAFPLIAGNKWDGFMLGMGLHNYQLPERRWQWAVLPMFGLRSLRPAGIANSQWRLRTTHNKLFRQAYLNAEFKSFSIGEESLPYTYGDRSFTKLKVGTQLTLRERSLSSAHRNEIQFSVSDINEHNHDFVDLFIRGLHNQHTATDLFHTYTFNKPFFSFSARSGLRMVITDEDEQLISAQEEINLSYRYHRSGHKLKLRLFFGSHLSNTTSSGRFNWQIDGPGTFIGPFSSDFRYEHYYLGRNTGFPDFLSQQMVEDQGGFAALSAYSSNDWMLSANFKFQLPFVIGLNLYANAGFIPYRYFSTSGLTEGITTLYDTGIMWALLPDVVHIYFPVFVSQEFRNEWDANGIKYPNRIRFTLNLNNANPVRLLQKVL